MEFRSFKVNGPLVRTLIYVSEFFSAFKCPRFRNAIGHGDVYEVLLRTDHGVCMNDGGTIPELFVDFVTWPESKRKSS